MVRKVPPGLKVLQIYGEAVNGKGFLPSKKIEKINCYIRGVFE